MSESTPLDEGPGLRPALTVDGVVLHRQPSGQQPASCSILLIQRGNAPYQGAWALPGGFVEYGEDIALAVAREVAEETGLSGLPWRQFRTYGAPDRDPRGHTVSVVYWSVLTGKTRDVQGGDDAAAAAWFAVNEVPTLAFDHEQILRDVLDELDLT